MLNTIKNVCRKADAFRKANGKELAQYGLFIFGLVMIAGAMVTSAQAQYNPSANYNDWKLAESVDIIFVYINGTFGVLVMLACGVSSIAAAAFGNYKAAMGLLVCAIGFFILRSVVDTWFNTENLLTE